MGSAHRCQPALPLAQVPHKHARQLQAVAQIVDALPELEAQVRSVSSIPRPSRRQCDRRLIRRCWAMRCACCCGCSSARRSWFRCRFPITAAASSAASALCSKKSSTTSSALRCTSLGEQLAAL